MKILDHIKSKKEVKKEVTDTEYSKRAAFNRSRLPKILESVEVGQPNNILIVDFKARQLVGKK